MQVNVMQFDQPLLGFPTIGSGYRVLFSTRTMQPGVANPLYNDLLSWLCDYFGEEGTTRNVGKHTHSVVANDWAVGHTAGRDQRMLVVVRSHEVLLALAAHWNWNYEIDTTQTIDTAVRGVLIPFMFAKVSAKLVRRIQAQLANLLTQRGSPTQWYQIHFSPDCSVVEFDWRDSHVKICLTGGNCYV